MVQINSRQGLSGILDIPEWLIHSYVNKKDGFYSIYQIPKKTGGTRTLTVPSTPLKKIQKKILEKILYLYPVQDAACGFVRGKSLFENAAPHINKKYVYKTDIKDFFPSITSARIHGLFVLLGYNASVANDLTELCTYNKKLPQGTPTSPHLSNLICRRMDVRLSGLARRFNLQYTRYADDMTFSGNRFPKKFKQYVGAIIAEEGFQIEHKKDRFITQKHSQSVTGLIVNRSVGIGRKRYLRLRSIIYNCRHFSAASQNIDHHPNFKSHLYGHAAFVNSIDKEKAQTLYALLNVVNWEGHSYKAKDWRAHPLVLDVIDLFTSINKLTSNTIFLDNNKDVVGIMRPVLTMEDFNARVSTLIKFFDQLNTQYFIDREPNLKSVDLQGNRKKSIQILTDFFIAKGVTKVRFLVSVHHLRKLGAGLVRHNGRELSRETDEAITYYKCKPADVYYPALWYNLLDDLRSGLRSLYQDLKICL